MYWSPSTQWSHNGLTKPWQLALHIRQIALVTDEPKRIVGENFAFCGLSVVATRSWLTQILLWTWATSKYHNPSPQNSHDRTSPKWYHIFQSYPHFSFHVTCECCTCIYMLTDVVWMVKAIKVDVTVMRRTSILGGGSLPLQWLWYWCKYCTFC